MSTSTPEPSERIHPEPLVHIALFSPEIPQNTGNVARLCAALSLPLHIVGEPAFSMSEKALRRAGLDYWPLVDLHHHESVWHLLERLGQPRLLPLTTHATKPLSQARFAANDLLAFGSEGAGLPPEIHRDFGEHSLRIDQWGEVRSLNLSTAVGIVAYEAMRQLRI